MKKEIESKFDIKLNFDKNTENPSRLFKSFADIIDGFNQLNYVLGQSVNTTIESKVILNDIDKGSLIARFRNNLIIGEYGKIDDTNDNDKIREYIEESRENSIEFASQNKFSAKELNDLQNDIKEIAKDKKIDKTFNYAEPDTLELAKSINSIKSACEGLVGNESFTIESANKEIKGLKPGAKLIDIEEVENALTEQEIINESVQYYLIKKPDFLGESSWVFKHGSKSVTAKIDHIEWIEKFHKGLIPVVPGDSLKVKVRQTSKYNRNGYLISDKLEIIEVMNIINNQNEKN
jgi:predicted house-cleaning noncanonical NTP pyrophosphatase (MazG superfamily)